MSNTNKKVLSKKVFIQAIIFVVMITIMTACQRGDVELNVEDIPPFSESPYVELVDNVPLFAEDEITTTSFEKYSPLDDLGRCGVAFACVGQDIMPTEDRKSISSVTPTGWQSIQYDVVDGGYLYNRSHLIGFQLTGENATEENLITGTRYMNVTGMLPFENMVADYIIETGNHVMYRVTPYFEDDNLLANGVQLEAYSVEDEGEGISFNVYIYNNQPWIDINYKDGSSKLNSSYTQPEEETEVTQPTEPKTEPKTEIQTEPTEPKTEPKTEIQTEPTEPKTEATEPPTQQNNKITYILNIDSMKFHEVGCWSADTISPENKSTYEGTRDELINKGYSPCGHCDP